MLSSRSPPREQQPPREGARAACCCTSRSQPRSLQVHTAAPPIARAMPPHPQPSAEVFRHMGGESSTPPTPLPCPPVTAHAHGVWRAQRRLCASAAAWAPGSARHARTVAAAVSWRVATHKQHMDARTLAHARLRVRTQKRMHAPRNHYRLSPLMHKRLHVRACNAAS